MSKVILQTLPPRDEMPASLGISVLERQYPKILFENNMFTVVIMSTKNTNTHVKSKDWKRMCKIKHFI